MVKWWLDLLAAEFGRRRRKHYGAENPPEKNAVGRISAEEKNAAATGIFFRLVFGGGTNCIVSHFCFSSLMNLSVCDCLSLTY